jgi:type IV secretory pathway VirB2 component (pilin)
MIKNVAQKQGLMLAALAVAALAPDLAAAAGPAAGDGITKALCAVVSSIQGTIGMAIATIAIMVIGFGALMGKVSWGTAIIVLTGIGIIFGASSLVKLVNGDGVICTGSK